LGCAFSKLEFKRVILRNLSLLLDYLREEGSFLAAIRRANKLRRGRRAGTLISILVWIGVNIEDEVSWEEGESFDSSIAESAELFIDNSIEWIWARFDTLVDTTVDQMKCARAAEGPKRSRTNRLDVTVHELKCRDRTCNNANVLRSMLPKIRELLNKLETHRHGKLWTDDLEEAYNELTEAVKNPSRLYDYQNCLAVGDVWIHLECLKAGARKFVTSNYKESQILCPALQLEMINPRESETS